MKIPVLSEDLQEEHWIAITKVLLLGWRQDQDFPMKLAESFIEKCLLEETSDNLVEFLAHTKHRRPNTS